MRVNAFIGSRAYSSGFGCPNCLTPPQEADEEKVLALAYGYTVDFHCEKCGHDYEVEGILMMRVIGS